MMKLKATISVLLFAATISSFATTIADWTFETSQPTTAGTFAPEMGSGSASGFHAGSASYSSPAGNGSSHSFSANTWAVGDYWQFQISTSGFQSISINWDQTGSSTGPNDFILEYSINGTGFNQIGSDYMVQLSNWSSTTTHSGFTFAPDLNSIESLIAGQATVCFRLVDNATTAIGGGSVASGGTDRIDNFTVTGTAISEHVPDSLPIGFSAAAFLSVLFISRHFHKVNAISKA